MNYKTNVMCLKNKQFRYLKKLNWRWISIWSNNLYYIKAVL